MPRGSMEGDGRVLRGRRNHDAVVDALLALVEDGDVNPTAEAIAERAGLSRRSVFQHYTDMEAIYQEAARRTWVRLRPLFEPLDTTVALPERVELFLHRRRQICELLDPVSRSARLREPVSAQLRASRADILARQLAQARQAFEPELVSDAEGDLATAICVATSWACWELLVVDVGLDRDHALHLMGRTVRALLAMPDVHSVPVTRSRIEVASPVRLG